MCPFSTMNWPNSSNALYLLSVWLHHSIYPGVTWWDSGESVLKWFSMLDASDVGAEQRSLVLDRDTRLLSEYSKCFNWRQIWWVRRPVSWLYVSWNVLIQPTNGCSRSMTPSAILLKNSVFLLREKLPLGNIASILDSIKCRLHYLGQDIVNVIFQVHSCSLGNEVKRS